MIIFILFFLITGTINANATVVDRVLDGDTVEIKNPTPPKEILMTKHRLAGIDTPESLKQFAKCEKEIILGLKAKEFTKNFVKGEVEIIYIETDKYGRYLINIRKNDRDLAEELVKSGLAYFYDGGTKIKNWCN